MNTERWYGLIELLLVFGVVLGWAVWQWWGWWRWRRSQQQQEQAKAHEQAQRRAPPD